MASKQSQSASKATEDMVQDRNAYQKARQKLVSRQKALYEPLLQRFRGQFARYGMDAEEFVAQLLVPALRVVIAKCIERGWTVYKKDIESVWERYANSYPLTLASNKLMDRILAVVASEKILKVLEEWTWAEEVWTLIANVKRYQRSEDVDSLLTYLKWRDPTPRATATEPPKSKARSDDTRYEPPPRDERPRTVQEPPQRNTSLTLVRDREIREHIIRRQQSVPRDDPHWFEVLGLPASITDYREARRAYRQLARETHPDFTKDDTRFKQVSVAWLVAEMIFKAEGLVPTRYEDRKK